MKLYKDVILEAWQFTINHAQLWIFGLFAIFIVGNGGEIDRYLRYVNSLVKDGSILNPAFWTEHAWFNAAQQCTTLLLAGDVDIWSFMILFITSCVIVAYMMMVAQGALISVAGQTGKTFIQAFRSGQQHAWQLFILHLITYLTITVSTLLVVGVVVAISDQSLNEAQSVLMIVGTVLLIPMVLVISFVARYASMHIVVDNVHVFSALRSSWTLLWNNVMVTVEMAIVVVSLALVVNLALLLTTFLIVTPYLSTIITTEPGSMTEQLFNGVFIGAVVYGLNVILVGAIFSTWQWTAWTLLFKRLKLEKHTSKLVRIFAKQS